MCGSSCLNGCQHLQQCISPLLAERYEHLWQQVAVMVVERQWGLCSFATSASSSQHHACHWPPYQVLAWCSR